MNHEPRCGGTMSCNCDCDALRAAYQRGREDAAEAVWAKVLEHNTTITGRIWETSPDQDDYMAAARGAEPHQGDTDQHPDSQQIRYGNGNNIPTVGNTILDDSDDEKVVADNYVDNVTDAGDTPQPATNWVRSLLQTGELDTPDTEQNEPINDVVRTVTPADALQNRQDEERFVGLRICGPGAIDETVPGPSESDYIVANIARILNEFPQARRTLSEQILINQKIRDAIGGR